MRTLRDLLNHGRGKMMDLAVLQAECFGMQRALLSEYDPDTKEKRNFLGWTKIDGALYVEHMILRLQRAYKPTGDHTIPWELFATLQKDLTSIVQWSAPEIAIQKIVATFVDFTKEIKKYDKDSPTSQ